MKIFLRCGPSVGSGVVVVAGVVGVVGSAWTGNVPQTSSCTVTKSSIIQLKTCFHEFSKYKVFHKYFWVEKETKFLIWQNGILLPKLFWPTVRKNCSNDREKLLKFEAEAEILQNFWGY